MSTTTKQSFPTFPMKQWWALRRAFDRSMPSGIVSADYLATVLDMTPGSARNNILPGLKFMGLVGEDGKATQRANRWRDDEEYPSVCEEIRADVYPDELRSAFTGGELDRQRLERWFQLKSGAGASAAEKMAALFELLTLADPTKQDSGRTRGKAAGAPKQKLAKPKVDTAPDSESPPLELSPAVNPIVNRNPSLHIDVQIHISPESDANQIDQIFESMAKHLNLGNQSDAE